MVLVQMWAAGAGTPGSLPPHLLQSRSLTDGLAEGAVPSGLAAVPAAPAGVGQMMTGGLSPMETEAPGVEGQALDAEDLTPGAQTPAGLSPGAVV